MFKLGKKRVTKRELNEKHTRIRRQRAVKHEETAIAVTTVITESDTIAKESITKIDDQKPEKKKRGNNKKIVTEPQEENLTPKSDLMNLDNNELNQ